jgi:biopolymer transport protein ExbD
MRTPTRRRRLPLETELPFSAMVDVVFLLLVFFLMVFSQPLVLGKLDVFRPEGVPPRGEAHLQIQVHEDTYAMGLSSLPPKVLSLAELDAELARVARIDANQTLAIGSARPAVHDRLIQVLNLCARHGLVNLTLTTLQ